MRIIWGYFKERAWFALLLVLCVGLFAQVLRLYDLPAEAVGYASLLCAAAFAVWTAVDLLRCRERVRYLESLRGQAALLLDQLPEARGPREEVYQALLLELGDTLRAVSSASDARRRETLDYYTMWVHQIKTPIAAMRLLLREDPADHVRDLEAELFRVERYVELALSYLRLDGGGTDYLIREYALDAILRQAARKYAPPLHPEQGVPGAGGDRPPSAHGREVAATGGGAGPLQRRQIRPRRTCEGLVRGRAPPRPGRRRGHRPRGPAPGLRPGLHRLQWPHGQAGHRHRPLPEPGDLPPPGPHHLPGLRAREGHPGHY